MYSDCFGDVDSAAGDGVGCGGDGGDDSDGGVMARWWCGDADDVGNYQAWGWRYRCR